MAPTNGGVTVARPAKLNEHIAQSLARDDAFAQLARVQEDPDAIFVDLHEIGHGNFGAVYFARHARTQGVVAVKKMVVGGKHSEDSWADVVKEVKFIAKLSHPNCVRFKGCWLKGATCWLAMEYCLGSASDVLEVVKPEPLREAEIAAIVYAVLSGLHYLHRRGHIHRDVKAGNVLLTEEGCVKLADFGSAALTPRANSFIGTPYWMSPEMILSMDEKDYDAKIDIWSLGITCIELAERHPPLWKLNSMAALYHIAQNDPPRLGYDSVDGEADTTTPQQRWSPAFHGFVASCLTKEADQRPTAAQLLDDEPFVQSLRVQGDGAEAQSTNNTLVILDLLQRTKNKVQQLDNLATKKIRKMVVDMDAPIGTESETNDLPLEGDKESLTSGSTQTSRSRTQSDAASDDYSTSKCSTTDRSDVDEYARLGDVATSGQQQQQQPATSGAISGPTRSASSVSGHRPSQTYNTSTGSRAKASPAKPAGAPPLSIGTLAQDIRAASQKSDQDKTGSSVSSSQSGQHDPTVALTTTPTPPAGFRVPPELERQMSAMSPGSHAPGNFPTIKTHNMVAQQRMAAAAVRRLLEDDFRQSDVTPGGGVGNPTMFEIKEQVTKLKRLKKLQKKETEALEGRNKADMDAKRSEVDKEYDQLITDCDRDSERLGMEHQKEIDRFSKTVERQEQKLLKELRARAEQDRKTHENEQSREYQQRKEETKRHVQMVAKKAEREEQMKQFKAAVRAELDARRNDFLRRLKHLHELQIRAFQRRKLIQRHALQHRQLCAELAKKDQQLKLAHDTLKRHHETFMLLEYEQLFKTQDLKVKQIQHQHDLEVANQNEQIKREQKMLERRQHDLSRRLPKKVKDGHKKLKVEFQHAVKTQEQLARAKEAEIRADQSLSKEQKQERIGALRQSEDRVLRQLHDQYRLQCRYYDQVHNQAWQTRSQSERSELKSRCATQTQQLRDLQKRMMDIVQRTKLQEKTELQQKIDVRKALLDQKMNDEIARLAQNRDDRLHGLHVDQKEREANFDRQTTEMGLDVDLVNYTSAAHLPNAASLRNGSSTSSNALAHGPAFIEIPCEEDDASSFLTAATMSLSHSLASIATQSTTGGGGGQGTSSGATTPNLSSHHRVT